MRAGLLPFLIVAVALLVPSAADASLTVANQNDSGPGSLRETITGAPPGETVVVPAGTYTLTSGEIPIAQSVQIEGAGPSQTVIRTNGTSRIFGVSGGTTAVTISGVTLRDGRIAEPSAIGEGGAIFGSGIASLVLRNVVATNNTVDVSGAPGKFGGIGEGGAVAVLSGDLAIFE